MGESIGHLLLLCMVAGDVWSFFVFFIWLIMGYAEVVVQMLSCWKGAFIFCLVMIRRDHSLEYSSFVSYGLFRLRKIDELLIGLNIQTT